MTPQTTFIVDVIAKDGDKFIYYPQLRPWKGRVVECSAKRNETEGLISPQKKREYYKAVGIATSAMPPRNDSIISTLHFKLYIDFPNNKKAIWLPFLFVWGILR